MAHGKCPYLLDHFSSPATLSCCSYYNLIPFSSSSSSMPLLFSCLFFFLNGHMVVYKNLDSLPAATTQEKFSPPPQTVNRIAHFLPDIDRPNFAQVITTCVCSRLQ